MGTGTMKGQSLHSAFPNRITNYWNKIPIYIKDAESTQCFKMQLEAFKKANITSTGHYWELSEEIFSKIDSKQQNRDNYVSYMIENPSVAKRRFINITDKHVS